jgi:hypothetical protein
MPSEAEAVPETRLTNTYHVFFANHFLQTAEMRSAPSPNLEAIQAAGSRGH